MVLYECGEDRLVFNAIPCTPNRPVTVLKNVDSILMTTLRESPVAELESSSQDSIIMDSSTLIEDKAETSDSLLSLRNDSVASVNQSFASGPTTLTPALQVTPSTSKQRKKKYTPHKLLMSKKLKRQADSLR